MTPAPPPANPAPLYLLFPLASSLLYVAAALSLKRASDAGAGLWRSSFVMNLAVAVCFAPLYRTEGHGPGPTPFWQAALIAALFVAGQVLTMLALTRGDVSVATPVVGTKVIFVAVFVTLIVGDDLPVDYWLSAGMSAAGIALLNRRGGGGGTPDDAGPDGARPATDGAPSPMDRPRRNLALTVSAALAAAGCYALFDVLVRKWAAAWGVGLLLPSVMGVAAAMSLGLWPAFEGRLRDVPRAGRGPLLLGSLFLGLQALLLVRTLGLHADTTRINIVYNTRGLWSVAAVWLIGHWWGNTERHAGRAALAWRMAGATLLLAAILVAVLRPMSGRAAG